MDSFVKERCFVCDTSITESDIIKLQNEGTSYAARSGERLTAEIKTPSALV